MTPLFLYLLKVNIALVLFYLAYRYGLRRLTFYTLNRFYLLFAIGFSSLYPLIDLSGLVRQRQAAGGEIIYYLPDLGNMAVESPLQIWNVLAFVFWSGVVVMGIRFLIQLISLARLHFTSRKQDGEKRIRTITEKINPFSFFANIYINPLLHDPAERASIVSHEKVHIRQWHTLDILAGEFNRIFYWFNPGAWLMMVAIRENLEFIADRKVLKSGIDAKTYQYGLVKVSEIPYASQLANNFNFSHLKIRITMMDKKPSSELHLVKYLVLIPFVAITALAFNVASADNTTGAKHTDAAKSSTSSATATTNSSGSVLNEAAAILDTVPGTDTGKTSSMPPDKVVIGYPSPEQPAEGYQNEEKTSPMPPDKVVIGYPSPPADTVPGVVVRKIVTPAKTDSGKDQRDPLILLDGIQVDQVDGIASEDIASVSVLKGEQATSLFGKKAEDGAILITSKGNAMQGGVNSSDAVSIESAEETQADVETHNGLPLDQDILFIINGVEVSANEVEVLAPGKIKSINVLKDKSATDKYGEKGEHGVIEITTKDQKD